MHTAYKQFQDNLTYARHLGGIYQALRAQTTSALDLSDIIRAELVMAVSALDHYIHELTRIGMCEIVTGKRAASKNFSKFSVSLEKVLEGFSDPANPKWLDDEVRLKLGWQSFQQPDKVADAIRLFADKNVWEALEADLGIPAADLKALLSEIVDRRNKIAHEADIDPASGQRRPIDEKKVQGYVEYVEKLGEAILRVTA